MAMRVVAPQSAGSGWAGGTPHDNVFSFALQRSDGERLRGPSSGSGSGSSGSGARVVFVGAAHGGPDSNGNVAVRARYADGETTPWRVAGTWTAPFPHTVPSTSPIPHRASHAQLIAPAHVRATEIAIPDAITDEAVLAAASEDSGIVEVRFLYTSGNHGLLVYSCALHLGVPGVVGWAVVPEKAEDDAALPPIIEPVTVPSTPTVTPSGWTGGSSVGNVFGFALPSRATAAAEFATLRFRGAAHGSADSTGEISVRVRTADGSFGPWTCVGSWRAPFPYTVTGTPLPDAQSLHPVPPHVRATEVAVPMDLLRPAVVPSYAAGVASDGVCEVLFQYTSGGSGLVIYDCALRLGTEPPASRQVVSQVTVRASGWTGDVSIGNVFAFAVPGSGARSAAVVFHAAAHGGPDSVGEIAVRTCRAGASFGPWRMIGRWSSPYPYTVGGDTPRPQPGPPPALVEIPEGVRETEVTLPADVVRSLAGTAVGSSSGGGGSDVAVCEVKFTYQSGSHGLQLYMCALRFFA